MKTFIFGLIAFGLIPFHLATAEVELQHRVDWMHEAGWGVMFHYLGPMDLNDVEASVERWNQLVDAFDVEKFAELVHAVGAKYVIFTLGQNSGLYCSPNAAYDRIVGYPTSHCSQRDLVLDLSNALQAHGIRLIAYLPSGAPDQDPKAMEAFAWAPSNSPEGKKNPRMASFQAKWESVIREWAERWGERIAGWWFDGCYYAPDMYEFPDPPNFASFAEAARAGNPNAIVTFNPGVKYPIGRLSQEEDYTAGEINEPENVECSGRWVDGAQFMMLSYLGESWCRGMPRFTNDRVVEITRSIIEKGGVVTWDVPIDLHTNIHESFIEQLKALNQALTSK